jgi:endonuclease-8
VPEGDTLFRTAAGLRPHLVGRVVEGARARLPGPQVQRLIGTTIIDVDTQGKHLLIRFDSGLELRTHLGMNGSWHRYRPGERWRRSPSRAHLVLEVAGAVAVCFEPAAVELFETRVEEAGLHPVLAALGPDILADDFPLGEALARLRDPIRASLSIAEALLDQRALAGIGNVYKNEALFLERVDPFVRVADVDDPTLERLVLTARRLMRANLAGFSRDTMTPSPLGGRSPRSRLWVYGRAGLPCRRCGTLLEARRHGAFPRRTFWCPSCLPTPDA